MSQSWYSYYRFQIISWIIAFNVFGISLYFMLLNHQEALESSMPLRFWPGLLLNTICGVIMGLVLGSIDVLLSNYDRKKRSFFTHFLIKSMLYLIVFITSVLITSFSMQWLYKGQEARVAMVEMQENYALNIMLAYVIFTASTSILINFLGQMRRIIGPRTLSQLFWGKYFSPRSEERIFLFLDLKESTTIAEKLGHVRYSSFIQDCFFDLNQVVPQFKAEIYQYVGDEAVLHWDLTTGLQRQYCLMIFNAFKGRLHTRASYYLETYGIRPFFKAGLHCGTVTVTEVGEIKKEIAYHGDVLNTAARLEKACEEHQAEVLISAQLKHLLEDGFNGLLTSVGKLKLKGKTTSVEAYKVQFDS